MARRSAGRRRGPRRPAPPPLRAGPASPAASRRGVTSEPASAPPRAHPSVSTRRPAPTHREPAFGPLVEALALSPESRDGEARELGALISGPAVPDAVRVEAPDVRFRVVEGLVAMIERLAWERPVVLAIDDLHWSDPSTLLT